MSIQQVGMTPFDRVLGELSEELRAVPKLESLDGHVSFETKPETEVHLQYVEEDGELLQALVVGEYANLATDDLKAMLMANHPRRNLGGFAIGLHPETGECTLAARYQRAGVSGSYVLQRLSELSQVADCWRDYLEDRRTSLVEGHLPTAELTPVHVADETFGDTFDATAAFLRSEKISARTGDSGELLFHFGGIDYSCWRTAFGIGLAAELATEIPGRERKGLYGRMLLSNLMLAGIRSGCVFLSDSGRPGVGHFVHRSSKFESWFKAACCAIASDLPGCTATFQRALNPVHRKLHSRAMRV